MLRLFLSVLLWASAFAGPVRADMPLYVHPEDRAAGTRRDAAVQIGRALLTVLWPATITQIRVDGVSGHQVAGITLSAVKFHRALDREGFLAETASLITKAFAHSDVEEVDVWAIMPIPVPKGAVVSGDYAVAATRTVFACTVRRTDLAHLSDILHNEKDVYWASDFAASLSGKPLTVFSPKVM